jgi:hypothetical protein
MDARHRRLQTALRRLQQRTTADASDSIPARWALNRAAREIAWQRRPVRVLIPFADHERQAA